MDVVVVRFSWSLRLWWTAIVKGMIWCSNDDRAFHGASHGYLLIILCDNQGVFLVEVSQFSASHVLISMASRVIKIVRYRCSLIQRANREEC